MNKTNLLKNIFELAHQGIYVPLDNLPYFISKDVVEKKLLYIELQNLVKNNGDTNRIEEIKLILNPPEQQGVEGWI